MKPFRIAHLSDLHLTRRDDAPRTELSVFRPLKGMNAAFRKIVLSPAVRNADFVLVTGDVTDRGEIEAWNVFWEGLQEAGLTDRVAVIPGNHDVCCLGARLPRGRMAYRDSDLEKAVRGLNLGRQPVRYPCVFIPDPRIVVFGLNSNNLGNLSVAGNAMGQIGYYQLGALASLLHKHRDVPVKIIVLHHSPNIPGEETARKRGLRPFSPLERLGHQIPQEQRRALLLLCVTHRVRLVVHGHLHQAEDRRVGGVRIIGAPATTEPLAGRDGGAGSQKPPHREYEIFRYEVSPDAKRVSVRRLHIAAADA